MLGSPRGRALGREILGLGVGRRGGIQQVLGGRSGGGGAAAAAVGPGLALGTGGRRPSLPAPAKQDQPPTTFLLHRLPDAC